MVDKFYFPKVSRIVTTEGLSRLKDHVTHISDKASSQGRQKRKSHRNECQRSQETERYPNKVKFKTYHEIEGSIYFF